MTRATTALLAALALAPALAAPAARAAAQAPLQQIVTRTMTGCSSAFSLLPTCSSIAFRSAPLAGGGSDVTVSVTNLQGRGADGARWSAITGYVIHSHEEPAEIVQQTTAPAPNGAAEGAALPGSWGIVLAFGNVGLFGGLLETDDGGFLFDGIGGCGVGSGFLDNGVDEVRQGVRTCAPGSAALFHFTTPFAVDPRALDFVHVNVLGQAGPFDSVLDGSCTLVTERGLGPMCTQVSDVTTVAAVPEPASLALLGGGLALLAGAARRRRGRLA